MTRTLRPVAARLSQNLPATAFGLLALVACWHAFGVLGVAEHMMDSDEAAHTLPAVRMQAAIARGDLDALLNFAKQLHWYPPGHSLVLAGWFGLFGPSITAARLFSLTCYVGLGVVMWRFSLLLDRTLDRWPAALAIGALAADMQLRRNATLSMLEPPALLGMLSSFWLAAIAWKNARLPAAFGASLCVILTLMTKYDYGLLAFGGVGATVLRESWRAFRGARPKRRTISLVAAMLGPTFVWMMIWFIWLGHWESVLEHASAQRTSGDRYSVESLTFYIKALTYGSPATVVFLALLAVRRGPGPGPKAQERCSAGQVALGAAFVTNFLVLMSKVQKTSRFGAGLAPSLWLLCVGPLAGFRQRLSGRQQLALGGLIVALVLAQAPGTKALVGTENTDATVIHAYAHIYRAAREHGVWRVYLLERADIKARDGTTVRSYSAPALEVYLMQECARERPVAECKFHVWYQHSLRRRTGLAFWDWPTQKSIETKTQFAVYIRDQSRAGVEVPTWIRKWPATGPVETPPGSGLFVETWARPRR